MFVCLAKKMDDFSRDDYVVDYALHQKIMQDLDRRNEEIDYLQARHAEQTRDNAQLSRYFMFFNVQCISLYASCLIWCLCFLHIVYFLHNIVATISNMIPKVVFYGLFFLAQYFMVLSSWGSILWSFFSRGSILWSFFPGAVFYGLFFFLWQYFMVSFF